MMGSYCITFAVLYNAADMGRPPGEIRILPPQQMTCLIHSTRTIPISLLAQYLKCTPRARVAVLGIQPIAIGFEIPLSKEVSSRIAKVVLALKKTA
jgi:hydrogenase 3 maturation protease